jgi:hypothetical protein
MLPSVKRVGNSMLGDAKASSCGRAGQGVARRGKARQLKVFTRRSK